nr:eukaryotic translation initiation factor 5B-like [Ipomoea batatas]
MQYSSINFSVFQDICIAAYKPRLRNISDTDRPTTFDDGRTMSQSQDYDHFGHRHTLVPLVLDDGERLTCKGCELSIDHPFHGCISCAYYLHDRCLHAPRSLQHAAHPAHPLTLLPAPTYSAKNYVCDACRSKGTAFSYSCCHCGFDVHLHCASLPETAALPEKHPHALKLVFDYKSEENTVFLCDVCNREVDEGAWRYYCAGCDFGTHLHCSGVGCLERVGDEDDGDGGETAGVNDHVAAMRQATKEMMELQLASARMQNSLNLSAAYANMMRRW